MRLEIQVAAATFHRHSSVLHGHLMQRRLISRTYGLNDRGSIPTRSKTWNPPIEWVLAFYSKEVKQLGA
jgi:uncharacterized membrane protein YbaN (DUF454 family)